MKRIKRLFSVTIIIVLIFTLCVPVTAKETLNNSEANIDEVREAMNTVSDSLLKLQDTASSADAGTLANMFNGFVEVATVSGRILTAINGSVTFLRLIGIMSDPNLDKLEGIMSKLQVIDERLSSMDDKLNDLTTAMSEIKASVEFNSRTEKAILYEGAWRDFEYRYMEAGMDKLITRYNSMLRSGLMSWCNGNRNENNVDNSRIILLYKKTGDGYTLTYSDNNGIPSDISEEDRWIVIPTECLPVAFSYDVNTFNESLTSDIATRISSVISGGNYKSLESYNYPLLSEEGIGSITEEDIQALASDAVNTLVYRVASGKVNGDPNFAGEVSQQFSNYCSHLETSGDGLDATLKTFYLTHAFEYSTAEDIEDFCDRIIILTGTYGMFASNVLGMSHLTTDSEKIAAVSQMTSAIKMVHEARENGITGYGNYCYITGTRLKYTTVTFEASAGLSAHYTVSNTTFESFKGTGPAAKYGIAVGNNVVPAGDTVMIILMNTLKSNGVTANHDYLNEKLGSGSVQNYGKVVTGFGSSQTLSFDGKTCLHVKNAFGRYFADDSTITSLPEDADLEDVVFRKKVSGSLYDLSSGMLESNMTLCAIAVYGENHFYWVTDEGAFMGGPYDSSFFRDEYTVNKTGSDSTGVIRQHLYDVSSSYNILMSVPITGVKNSENEGYDPLAMFEEEVPPYEYNQKDYNEDGDKGLLGTQSEGRDDQEGDELLLGSQTGDAADEWSVPVIIAFGVSALAAVYINIRRKNKKQADKEQKDNEQADKEQADKEQIDKEQ